MKNPKETTEACDYRALAEEWRMRAIESHDDAGRIRFSASKEAVAAELVAMSEPPDVRFFVDDRGNIAQFYEFSAGDLMATLDREATVNGVRNQLAWDGSGEVEDWAIANGYRDEIYRSARVSEL